MQKKLVYVTTRLPWPSDDGRKVTLFNYCKGLHDMCGYEVNLFSFLGTGQTGAGNVPSFVSSVTLAAEPSQATKAMNVAKSFFNRNKTLQASLFWSKENEARLTLLLKEINPDVVIVDMIRLLPYGELSKRLGYKTVIDIDDLLSKRYSRQAIQEAGNFLGAYSQKTSIGFNRLAGLKFIKKFALKQESMRMKNAELQCAERYDSVFFVSPLEAEEYKNMTGSKNVFCAGMGADVDYLSEEITCKKVPASASFVGNLSAAANVASIEYILDEVLPRVSSACTLYVVGNCPQDIKQKLCNREKIVFLGRVEDIRSSVKRTSLYLAPIAFGTGIKTKIVEAMAMGMCVITNSIGVEGLAVSNGENIIVEDTPEGLAASVDRLIADDQARTRIGQAALQYAMCNHRWENLLQAFPDNGF